MTENLDLKDYKLLYALSQNARQSHSQLAKTLGLSKNAIAYRINRLKERGVIERFLALVNHKAAGYSFYDVFLRLRIKKEQEKEINDYFKHHPNLILAYKLTGEWDYLLEFGCKNVQEFFKILYKLVDDFSKVLDSFETHISLETYKVEFLPYDICNLIGIKHVHRKFETLPETFVELDEFDRELLYALNRNGTISVINLAAKLKKSPETIIKRIKNLQGKNIIAKFAALVNYEKLGYKEYIILIDLRNIEKTRRTEFRQYIEANDKIRFAFFGASKPELLMKIVIKSIDQLDIILKEIKEKFFDIVVSQKYMLVSERIAYDQFPVGLI